MPSSPNDARAAYLFQVITHMRDGNHLIMSPYLSQMEAHAIAAKASAELAVLLKDGFLR